ncbi:MAG: SLC13 family permease [Xanthomonadales bacterium]|nr:SLC13 family permease [Xanthomonadales bacterium]NIN58609.1 SLC13 family permease [Xanthomonadales bacterium]NIN73898.1 SLC13 family permease [Xanthomonadales bacterium]NIO12367.1 SLC13 family permease [Xanthomonadales bacterium]NIP11002.1 SLC13 family permease [Xanthomonadales bacterium]
MLELALPNAHALAVMILIVAALVMFTREEIPLETTSLVVLVTLTVGFQLFPFEFEGTALRPSDFFLGFGNRALVAVCALMIVGQGLISTGALEPVGRLLAGMWRRGPVLSLLLTLAITAVLSAFINNTPIVVMLLPILIGVAIRTGLPSSGTLIPMGFASILGGMATTIGTSTNLLVVNVAADMGMDRFNMFDFVGPVLVAGTLAVVYLWLVAPRLIPERRPPMSRGVSRYYTAQIRLNPDSAVVGGTLADALARTGDAMRVETIQRGPGVFLKTLPDVLLKADDRITTSDTQSNLREYARVLGGTLFSGEHQVDAAHPLSAEGQQIAEVAITPASRLNGTRIGNARLYSRHGLRLLAFNRFEGMEGRESPGLDEIRLRTGDVLLVQSTPENLADLKGSPDFLVLDGSIELPRTRKAPLALATIIGVVALAALRIMPIEISALLGSLVLIVTGCLNWKDAMNALSTQVILIIVASLAMGAALLKTGGADYLASLFVSITFGAPPPVVLMGLMLMMGILTNVVSNNAAAVIGTPIAIGIAQRLGLPLEPFVLAVLFGANLSFVTPMSYQTNILIMNAGGYRFGDFVRVGLPLTILLWLVLCGVLIWAYGL